MTDLNMIESRPPVVAASGTVAQENIPTSLSKTLATDFDTRPCADFIQGMFNVSVLALSSDQTQALVGLGCGSTGLEKSIFIQKDGRWSKLGAASFRYKHELSGQSFDSVLEVPSCHDAASLSLDPIVAPVCYDGNPAQPDRYVYRNNHS